jgi:hypothetical protein
MVLTVTYTEKVPPLTGRSTHVKIGSNSTTGVDITGGLMRFQYSRVHPATRKFVANTKAASTDHQPHSHYTWRLEFLSDCRTAFFATDVTVGGGANDYAMDPNGDSFAIAFFQVVLPAVDGSNANITRTYTITNGYALRNGADINNIGDAVYWYEGDAEEITYTDT